MQKYWTAWLVLISFLAIWFVQTHDRFSYWGDASRLATIQSLVERGTWRIDESPFMHQTGDKVFLEGHFYSEKLPLFQAIAAVPYGLMYHLGGARMRLDSCPPGEICVYKWLTFLMVGIPSAVMLAVFYWAVAQRQLSIWRGLFATFSLAFASMVWPYSLTFNHHTAAAACLFVAFCLVTDQKSLFGAGLLCGLAASFDVLAGPIGAALLAVAFVRSRWKSGLFVLGTLPPIVATMFFNYQIWHSVLPAYFAAEGYNYPGSVWDSTLAAHHPPGDVLDYAFKYLIGERGFFSHSPILLWGLAGLILVLLKRGHPLRRESAILSLGMLAPLAYLLTRTNHYGGWAYSERFLIILVPLLFYYVPFALPSATLLRKPPAGWLKGWGLAKVLPAVCLAALLVISIALSALSAWQGVNHTWRESHPLIYPYTNTEPPYLALRIRLTGRDWQRLTSLQGLKRFGACPKWDLEGATILDELPPTAHPLMANFGGKIMLMGYDLPSRRVKAGESFPITVYWQSLSFDNDFYRQANQLLDSQLRRMGGFDRPPLLSNTACWEPGDVLVDPYPVPVSPEAEDGVYNLLVGLYSGEDENARFLRLVQNGHETQVENVTIGPIKVGGPPPGSTVNDYHAQHPTDISLGEIIKLVGYDSEWLNKDRLFLRLYWQSIAETEVDYTLFVHLLNDADEIVSQIDRPAAQRIGPASAYPTSLWDRGEVVLDEVALDIPTGFLEQIEAEGTTGSHSLKIGLYNALNGQRLPVSGSADGAIRLPDVW